MTLVAPGMTSVEAVAVSDGQNMVAQFDQGVPAGYVISRVMINGPQCPAGYNFELYIGGYAGAGLKVATTPRTDVNDAGVDQPVPPYAAVFGVWRNVIGGQANGLPAICTLVIG